MGIIYNRTQKRKIKQTIASKAQQKRDERAEQNFVWIGEVLNDPEQMLEIMTEWTLLTNVMTMLDEILNGKRLEKFMTLSKQDRELKGCIVSASKSLNKAMQKTRAQFMQMHGDDDGYCKSGARAYNYLDLLRWLAVWACSPEDYNNAIDKICSVVSPEQHDKMIQDIIKFMDVNYRPAYEQWLAEKKKRYILMTPVEQRAEDVSADDKAYILEHVGNIPNNILAQKANTTVDVVAYIARHRKDYTLAEA